MRDPYRASQEGKELWCRILDRFGIVSMIYDEKSFIDKKKILFVEDEWLKDLQGDVYRCTAAALTYKHQTSNDITIRLSLVSVVFRILVSTIFGLSTGLEKYSVTISENVWRASRCNCYLMPKMIVIDYYDHEVSIQSSSLILFLHGVLHGMVSQLYNTSTIDDHKQLYGHFSD
jgi:hypothetical protein